jgi:hypothetical protein
MYKKMYMLTPMDISRNCNLTPRGVSGWCNEGSREPKEREGIIDKDVIQVVSRAPVYQCNSNSCGADTPHSPFSELQKRLAKYRSRSDKVDSVNRY